MTHVITTVTRTTQTVLHRIVAPAGPLRACAPSRTFTFVLPGLLSLLLAVVPACTSEDPQLESSRQYAASLQAELGARLKSALAEGGPVAAIDVCHLEAPRISERLARGGPSRVGRTALKVRNPANAPDAAARQVLMRFERELENGAEPPPEDFSTTTQGGARYMRAIVTQPMCLTCHGPQLAPDVAAAIEQRYPEDRATGFAAGELRGAFIIDWPADERSQN